MNQSFSWSIKQSSNKNMDGLMNEKNQGWKTRFQKPNISKVQFLFFYLLCTLIQIIFYFIF